jgi:hypothetical protein
MAYRIPDNTQESSTTTGTGDIMLDGAVTDFVDFDDQCFNGDTVLCVIFEAVAPDVEREYGLYTYKDDAPGRRLERTDVRRSSNGGAPIDWQPGTRVVMAGASGKLFETFSDPGLANGLMVKIADGPTLTTRALTGSTKVPVTNGDGVAGPPTLSDAWIDAHVLDRDAAAAAGDRTMGGGLILGAEDTQVQGYDVSDDHAILGKDAETLANISRLGANDYDLEVATGGVLYPAVTIAPKWMTKKTFGVFATMDGAAITMPAVPTPAAELGAWDIYVCFHYFFAQNAVTDVIEMTLTRTGGLTDPTVVRKHVAKANPQAGLGIRGEFSYWQPGAVPGTTYVYTVTTSLLGTPSDLGGDGYGLMELSV